MGEGKQKEKLIYWTYQGAPCARCGGKLELEYFNLEDNCILTCLSCGHSFEAVVQKNGEEK